jgi:hypothetical protein
MDIMIHPPEEILPHMQAKHRHMPYTVSYARGTTAPFVSGAVTFTNFGASRQCTYGGADPPRPRMPTSMDIRGAWATTNRGAPDPHTQIGDTRRAIASFDNGALALDLRGDAIAQCSPTEEPHRIRAPFTPEHQPPSAEPQLPKPVQHNTRKDKALTSEPRYTCNGMKH